MKKMIILFACLLNATEYITSSSLIENTNDKLLVIQKQINHDDNIKEDIIEEYKNINLNIENTKIYNKELKTLLKQQQEKLLDINNKISKIDETKNAILPLMQNMLLALQKIIKEDIPFLLDERMKRIDRIKDVYENPELLPSQKLNAMLQAYKIEYDYSNNIQVYIGKINEKSYNFLRVGRVGLYYQSLDLKEYGFWNTVTKSWQRLDDMGAKLNISKGIKIAKKHISADLLSLPFLSKKDIK